jgi:hypothetical protein
VAKTSSSLLTIWVLGVSLVLPSAKAQELRRPSRIPQTAVQAAPHDSADGSYFILDGQPMLLELHHDTEVGTNKPIDVYMFVIEMQIMNSDGDYEPVGLQIHNYYTASPQDRYHDNNPNNARDCKLWNHLVTHAAATRDPKSKTWPYVEFLVASGARIVQTNEDGQVWWSDDVECWGANDRFSPF